MATEQAPGIDPAPEGEKPMELRQLEVFVSLAEHKNFSLAAEALHLSQPTVSAHLRALEQELHVQLVCRTTRAFALTVAGEKLQRYAVQLLQWQRKALLEVSGGEPEELRIGASSVPGQCLLPEALARFHQAMPQIRLNVQRSDSLEVIRKVEEGELDAGLVGVKTAAPCVFIPIAEDELVLAAPNNAHFQAYQKQKAPLKALLTEPFLLRSDRSGTRQEAERLCIALRHPVEALQVAGTIDDAETLRNCIAQGLGVSILSRRTAEPLARAQKLLLFPMQGEGWKRSLYLIYRQNPYMPHALTEWLRIVRHGASMRPEAAEHTAPSEA
ncbi:MAG: selenium metabolism-associated LysR family transcriptional regulator [Candidatus Limiplasma sp.]|nr:selenium metabolism-associated LysR family transcriptional regulator [Candidatus Limiplasma sp.]